MKKCLVRYNGDHGCWLLFAPTAQRVATLSAETSWYSGTASIAAQH